MIFKPHLYQQHAIGFCLEKLLWTTESPAGVGLFLDPGLGKTAITLSVLTHLKALGEMSRALVIAPRRVVTNVWPAEIDKWKFPLTHTTMRGGDRVNKGRRWTDIALINPESLLTRREGKTKAILTPALISELGFDTVVVDESTKFKSWSAARSKELRGMLRAIPKRIILTGTPSPNSLLDLHPQIYLLDEGRRLGKTVTEFHSRYCQQGAQRIGGGRTIAVWTVRPERKEDLETAISDIVLRLDAKDHLDLPPLLHNDIWVELPPQARKAYRGMEKELFALLHSGETLTASSAAAVYAKCRQIANGGCYDADRRAHEIHGAKIEALDDLVEELSGKPVLVAYQFQHDLERLLKWREAPAIRGGTSDRETEKVLAGWNAGNVPLLYCQPQAMSHGLNMQMGGCRDIAWFGLTDSLEVYDQLNARVYRQGVGGQVRIHHLLASDTVDLPIHERLEGKSQSQTALLDALKRYAKLEKRHLNYQLAR